MTYKIYSSTDVDLNPDIITYQKKVFDKFEIPIIHIIWNKNRIGNKYDGHVNFLKNTIESTKEDEYLIFFDVDCIPINKKFLNTLLNQISDNNTLAGILQANGSRTYIGSGFIGFSKKLYTELNPIMLSDIKDPFEDFTEKCILNDKTINMWMPTSSRDNIWFIKKYNVYYGHGTVYENLIYHEFQIRYKQYDEFFINKCKEIINS